MKSRLAILSAAFLALAGLPSLAADPPESPPSPLERRAAKILLPEMDFRETALPEIVDLLGKRSRALDPKKAGVNIILNEVRRLPRAPKLHGAAAFTDVDAPAPAPQDPGEVKIPGIDFPLPPEPKLEVPPRPPAPRVTLKLPKVSLNEALKSVAELAGYQLRWDEHAVVLSPRESELGANPNSRPPIFLPAGKEKEGNGVIALFETMPPLARIELHDATVSEAMAYVMSRSNYRSKSRSIGINIQYRRYGDGDAPLDEIWEAPERLQLSATNLKPLDLLRYTAELAGMEVSWDGLAINVTPPTALSAPKTLLTALQKRAAELALPSMDIVGMSLPEVIDYLSQQSRAVDPSRQGINLILKPARPGNVAPLPAPRPPPAIPGLDVPGAPAAPKNSDPPKTPPVAPATQIGGPLRNVPLTEALKYVANLSGHDLRWDAHAVVLVPKADPSGARRPDVKFPADDPKLGQRMLALCEKLPPIPKIDLRDVTPGGRLV
jgi:hypothetical protein